MPAWSVAEWRARIGSSWCALGRPFKTRSPFRGRAGPSQTKLAPRQLMTILTVLIAVIGINLGLRVVVAEGHHRAFAGCILGCSLFSTLRDIYAHLNQFLPLVCSNLICILGVYMLDFIWRNLDVLNVRMKRSLTLLVFVIAALMDVVERTAASVITFQLLLSGDIEENPGPDIDYKTVDTEPLDEDDLFDIIDEIVPSLNSKYYEIGLGLRLKSCALKDIKSSCQTPNIILTEVITAWLNKKYNVARFGPPTWQWLVRVVDSKAGGNDHDLAKKIASKHPARKSGTPEAAKEGVKSQEQCHGLTVDASKHPTQDSGRPEAAKELQHVRSQEHGLTVDASKHPDPAQDSGRPGMANEDVTAQEDGLTVDNLRDVLDLTWEYRANWKFLGTELNIKPGDIEAIAKSNHHKVEDCLGALLRTWLCNSPRPSRSVIIKALQSERVAHNIGTDRKPTSENKFGEYAVYLKSLYKVKQLATSYDNWPPPVTNEVFNLAMITTEKVQRGKIDDDYVRDTITGKVDDILRKKKPIELEGVFGEAKKGEPQKVLFEGAPGCGKSTLSLHICHEWTAGKLFQQFSHVILVKLRDPIVRRATKLAHLLPQRDESMALELEIEITSRDGSCILFIFDGWDELPSNVPGYELIKQILEKNKLHKCSVIITSRPISSANLYKLVNIRIEIIGFTRIQLNEYFIECLKNDTKNVEKLQQRIQDNPVVAGSCYLPLNASILVHLFKCDDNNLPSTLFGIFSELICNCIYRHLKKNKGCDHLTKNEGCDHCNVSPVKSLDHLPKDVEDPFKAICRLAYTNIKEERIVFELERDFNTLSLLQGVESFVKGGMPSRSYSFLHLSLQELLAAVYMAREMEPTEQVEQFRQLFGSPRFSAVFRYYSAVTKLKTPGINEIVSQVVQKCVDDRKATSLIEHSSTIGTESGSTSVFGHKPQPLLLSILHCLFEAQDDSLCQTVSEKLQQKLDLSGNNLDPADCLSIGYFLTHCKQFEVELNDSALGDDGCKALFKRGETYDLTTLRFHNSGIGIEGAMAIAAAVKTAPNLRVLYLAYNFIGNKGAVAVAEAIRFSTKLEELYLEMNNIGPEGAKALATAMKTTICLQKLKIGDNDIGEEGKAAIIEASWRTGTQIHLAPLLGKREDTPPNESDFVSDDDFKQLCREFALSFRIEFR